MSGGQRSVQNTQAFAPLVGLGAASLSVEVAGAGCVELTKNSEK